MDKKVRSQSAEKAPDDAAQGSFWRAVAIEPHWDTSAQLVDKISSKWLVYSAWDSLLDTCYFRRQPTSFLDIDLYT